MTNVVQQEEVPLKAGHVRHWLKEPVTATYTSNGGDARTEEIRFIDMRMKVKGKDMRATDAFTGPLTKQMGLIARLCGLPMAVIDEMAAEDITALMGLTQENPMTDGPQTGSALSA